jgi:hypothetical protein
MSRRKSIASCNDKIPVSSSSSNVEDHESLCADQEQRLEAHASTHDTE